MIRRFFLLLSIATAVILVLFLSYRFSMAHAPSPNKHDAEELVHAYDLKKFGKMESSYLETPKNFGFYNEQCIYVVEQALGDREEYTDRYAVIDSGEPLTSEEEKLAEQYKAQLSAIDPSEQVHIISKHKVAVYQKGEMIQSEWLFKAVYGIDGKKGLSFVPLPFADNLAINLFTDGYEQFKDF